MPQMTHAQKDEQIAGLNALISDMQGEIVDLVADNSAKDEQIKDLTIKLRQQIAKTNRAKSGSTTAPSHRSSNIRFSEPKSCHKPDCDFTFSTPDEGRAHAMAGVHGSVVDA